MTILKKNSKLSLRKIYKLKKIIKAKAEIIEIENKYIIEININNQKCYLR